MSVPAPFQGRATAEVYIKVASKMLLPLNIPESELPRQVLRYTKALELYLNL